MELAAVPLGGAIAAILCVVFMLAWAEWGATISTNLDVGLPIVGHVLGNLVSNALNDAYSAIVGWLDAKLWPLVSLLLAPLYALAGLFGSIPAALNALYVQVYSISRGLIPYAIGVAEQYALDLVNYLQSQMILLGQRDLDLINYVQSSLAATISGAVANLTGLINYVQQAAFRYADAILTQALTAVVTAEQVAMRYADGLYGQAVAYIDRALAQLASRVTAAESAAAAATADALAQAETFATTAAAAATGVLVTDLDKALAGAEAGVWTGVRDGVIAVEGVLGTDLPDIMAGIKAIPVDVPLDIAGAIAGAAAISIPMLKFMEQCGIPNCKNLSQLGRDLQALLGLVEDASFLALLIELIHSPGNAYQTIEDEFGSIITDTTSTMRSLFSV